MSDAAQTILVGRHRMFRECLARRLSRWERLRVVDQVVEVGVALERLQAAPVDLALVDLSGAEDDLDALAGLADRVRVVVLGLSQDGRDHLRCMEAGVRGYVPQDASFEDLRRALEQVLEGEVFCSPQVTYTMFSRLGELARERRRREQVEALELTPRELEVLQLVAEGLTNRQIGERICLSIYTVKNHVHNILSKLGVADREAAVTEATERRWLRERRRTGLA